MPEIITNASVERFRLKRMGRSQIISDDFHLLPPAVATSRIDNSCVFEHLYVGGWLADTQSTFGANLTYENARSQKRQKRPIRRVLNAIAPFFDYFDFKSLRRGKSPFDSDVAKNLKFRNARDVYLGKDHSIKFWHVAPRKALYSNVSVIRTPARISVIVPVYNIENYVETCLRSLQSQLYSNAEFLVVNDGSTDRSGDIAKLISGTDDRFRLIHKHNGGLGSARNLGLEYATGDYITFVDGDDWVTPTFLTNMANLMTRATDIVACDFSRVLPSGQVIEHVDIGNYYGETDSVKQLLLSTSDCFACMKLFRRQAFELEEFKFSDGCFEDFSNIPAIVGGARACSFTQCRDYKYIQRPGSILKSVGRNPWKIFDIFVQFDRLVEKQACFRSENWNIYYERKLLQHLFFYRIDAISQQPDPEQRLQLRRELTRRLNAAMPHWRETALMREYISVPNKGERRKRLKLVEKFGNSK